MYYFDTSALVKRYHKEKGTEIIDSIIEGDEDIYFSTIAIAETISALMRLKAAKLLTKKKYESIVGIFFHDIEQRYIPIPIDDGQIIKAIELIEKHNLRTLDAIHLSVAKEVKYMGKLIFVSADRKLLNAAEKEGFEILNPE